MRRGVRAALGPVNAARPRASACVNRANASHERRCSSALGWAPLTVTKAGRVAQASALRSEVSMRCFVAIAVLVVAVSSGCGLLGLGAEPDAGTPVTDVAAIAAGYDHLLLLKKDQTVWGTGNPSYGGLSTVGTVANDSVVNPKALPGVSGAQAISAGARASFAVRAANGAVLAFGHNEYGKLGDGSTTDRRDAATVTLPAAVSVVDAAGDFTLALVGGSVYAWGSNRYGQLGDATVTDRSAPVKVSMLSSATAISGGGYHSLALVGGAVWSWGANPYGQLGDGTTTERHVPAAVSGLSGVAQIAAGASFSVALGSDGRVWVWGISDSGQLGDGTTGSSRKTPGLVSGLSGVKAIAAGNTHALAVKSDGTVWAWGSNGDGELGDGSGSDSAVPVQVKGLTDVVAVSAGWMYSVALAADGSVWAWGLNSSGQLGDGTEESRRTPVRVRQ